MERGAHPARMDADTLSTMCSSQRVSGRGAGEELQQDLRKELLRRERKCESGSGVLPVARSAVPAGTRARLLLTYIRLVEGGRLQRDRRERVQRDAEGAPGAAQNDHKRRVERARAQSAAEGLLRRRLRSGGGGSAENVDTACPWELGDDQGTVRKLSGAREIVPNPGRSTFAVRERDATARSAWQANS